jgi:hypothetical protein
MMRLLRRRQEVKLDLAESEAPCHSRIYEEVATASPKKITNNNGRTAKLTFST